MAIIYAHGLNHQTKQRFESNADDFFRHTYNPDYSVSCNSGTLWISDPYGGMFSEKYQKEKLSYFLKGLKEGEDYCIEIK